MASTPPSQLIQLFNESYNNVNINNIQSLTIEDKFSY